MKPLSSKELADIFEAALGGFAGSALIARGLADHLLAKGYEVVERREHREHRECIARARGGHARAESLTPERRREIAVLGARRRWGHDG